MFQVKVLWLYKTYYWKYHQNKNNLPANQDEIPKMKQQGFRRRVGDLLYLWVWLKGVYLFVYLNITTEDIHSQHNHPPTHIQMTKHVHMKKKDWVFEVLSDSYCEHIPSPLIPLFWPRLQFLYRKKLDGDGG